MQIISRFLLVGFLTILGTSAFSGTAAICDNLLQMSRAYQKSKSRQSVVNPLAVMANLDTLATEIDTAEHLASDLVLSSAASELAAMVAELQLVAEVSQNDDVIGSVLFQKMSAQLEVLNRVGDAFGCEQAGVSFNDTDSQMSVLASETSGNVLSRLSGLPAYSIHSFLFTAVFVLLFLVAVFRLNQGRRDVRKICHTSLLMVYGDQCTVTHIVDMSRGGMKVEAAKKDMNRTWVDLYFCGHRVQGKIIWRNAYFAGIRFKTKVSLQIVEDVLQNSRKPLEESGLQGHATSCFSVGCHLNCPRHLPTAISEK